MAFFINHWLRFFRLKFYLFQILILYLLFYKNIVLFVNFCLLEASNEIFSVNVQ